MPPRVAGYCFYAVRALERRTWYHYTQTVHWRCATCTAPPSSRHPTLCTTVAALRPLKKQKHVKFLILRLSTIWFPGQNVSKAENAEAQRKLTRIPHPLAGPYPVTPDLLQRARIQECRTSNQNQINSRGQGDTGVGRHWVRMARTVGELDGCTPLRL